MPLHIGLLHQLLCLIEVVYHCICLKVIVCVFLHRETFLQLARENAAMTTSTSKKRGPPEHNDEDCYGDTIVGDDRGHVKRPTNNYILY